MMNIISRYVYETISEMRVTEYAYKLMIHMEGW